MNILGPHIPIWSRALSSPGRATGIANWLHSGTNNGNIGINRPRSASAPLVLYKQKYTLQFDRQTSLLSQVVDEETAAESKSVYLMVYFVLDSVQIVRF